jgi:uncharacterized protein YecE (DUF72 family)
MTTRAVQPEAKDKRIRAAPNRTSAIREADGTLGSLQIGTSGWTYAGWQGPFYPQDVPRHAWLAYYARQFSTTEINGSFYRTPSLEAVGAWRKATPRDFKFSWKASRFITHWKRLSDKSDNSIALMETRLKVLGPKLLAVLFQLPPQFQHDVSRLQAFLAMLPRRHRYTFEFRHKSWYTDQVLDLLQSANAALCLSDHRDAPSPWEATADFVYVRGHGPSGRYQGSYTRRTLDCWADSISAWRRQGRDVALYFDNDQKAAAPKDARRLREILMRPNAKSPKVHPRIARSRSDMRLPSRSEGP